MNTKKMQVLPARMRSKTSSSGRIFYYYDTCSKPRKWLPLGADYLSALKQYADYEMEYSQREMSERMSRVITFKFVADRYVAEILPTKAVATQKCNLRELAKLLEFFNQPPAPLDDIKPYHIREYLDWRSSAKVRANREVSLFSHIFNKAREWGYTDRENPCRGVSKNKESGRDVYITDELFWKLYHAGDKYLKYCMLVAYMTGQRVADVLNIELEDFKDGALWICQNKTGKKVRIELVDAFLNVINQIIDERGNATHQYLFSKNGAPFSAGQLRYQMDIARQKAGIQKSDFQFRDLRAKAATDREEEVSLIAAMEILGHSSSKMTSHYVRNRKGKLVAPTVLKSGNVEQE